MAAEIRLRADLSVPPGLKDYLNEMAKAWDCVATQAKWQDEHPFRTRQP
jgi:hypothetical protein